MALSVLVGVVVAVIAWRLPRRWSTPFLGLGLVVAPLLTVVTGTAPLLLAFQGPVLLLLACVSLVVAGVRIVGDRRVPRVPSIVLFVLALAFYLALGTRVPGASGPQGDEPHYLLMAHSLLLDGDLDLANQYAGRHYAPFYGGALAPHVSAASPPGRAFSSHAPGLAFILLPGFALGGYLGARVTLGILVALGAVLLRSVVRDSGASEGVALATWAVVALAPPVPFYAVAIYPETAAFVAVAFLLWVRDRQPRRLLAVAAALAAGGLAWLHPKFAPLGCVALALVLVRADRRSDRAWACVVFAAIVGGFLWYMRLTFGRAALSAGFGDPHLSLHRLPWGLLAELFDRQWGLFAVAPAWMLAAFGVVARLRRFPRDSIERLLVAAVPVAMGGAYEIWWGGACPPARFPLPALPALAVFLAAAIPFRRDLASALAGLSFGILTLAAGAPRVLHNVVPGRSGLLGYLGVVDLDGYLPGFFDARPLVTVTLALSLGAVGALVWRYRWRGLVGGMAAYVMLAGAFRERPVIDARRASLQILWDWDRDNWLGPVGPIDPSTLTLPLEMRGAPWAMSEGDSERSRAIEVPPGAYSIDIEAYPRGESGGRLLVGARARSVVVAHRSAALDRPPTLPLLLPVGAPGLRFEAEVAAGSAVVAGASVVARHVVPRSERGGLRWPPLGPEGYRIPEGSVFVTLPDGVRPEGVGFRLLESEGAFVLDGPVPDIVTARVLRPLPEPHDELIWCGRSVALGTRPDVAVRLPMTEGSPLGDHAVVVARLRARRAWVRFHGGRAADPGFR